MVCSWCFGCLWPLGDHKFYTLICTLTNNSIHDKTQNPSFFSKKYNQPKYNTKRTIRPAGTDIGGIGFRRRFINDYWWCSTDIFSIYSTPQYIYRFSLNLYVQFLIFKVPRQPIYVPVYWYGNGMVFKKIFFWRWKNRSGETRPMRELFFTRYNVSNIAV